MKTLFTFILTALLLLSSSCSTISVSKVPEKPSTTSKRNGILYCLPKTLFNVQVTIERTTEMPSYLYKEGGSKIIDLLILQHKLFDLKVITKEDSSFALTAINITPVTTADSAQLYFAEFRRRNALFISRKDRFRLDSGLFLTEGTTAFEDETSDVVLTVAGKVISSMFGGGAFTTAQSTSGLFKEHDSTLIMYINSVLLRIVEIRGIKKEILSGEMSAGVYNTDISLLLKKLTEEEEHLISLICGTKKVTVQKESFLIDPKEGNNILFNFTKNNGIEKNSTSLSDNTVVLFIQPNSLRERTDALFREKETQISKRNHGIYYRIPYNNHVEITRGGKLLLEEGVTIPQLGSVAFLPSKISFFASNISYEIDGKTGALKGFDTDGKSLNMESIDKVFESLEQISDNKISRLENSVKIIELQQQIENLQR